MKNIELYSEKYLKLVSLAQQKAKQQQSQVFPPNSPFKGGIPNFIKNQLKPYAETARNLISDQQTAKNLFDKIKAGSENDYKTVNKYIVMLEDYFIKWLIQLRDYNPQLFQQFFNQNLINVLSAMAKNLRSVSNGKNFQYTPFTLLIGGQTAPIDIDEWERQENIKKDPGY